jgi:hypothetical protein
MASRVVHPHGRLRIGIDLDNTLIDYDRVFRHVSVNWGLVPAGFVGNKRDIRDHIRLTDDGEISWQRLQAHVYGPAILGASVADGAALFIQRARARGAELMIVSHKTARANLNAHDVNLRDAARTWLRANGIAGPNAVPEGNVYFEDTRAEKIARIVALRCTHFIDDLEEVFDDPAFPRDIERLLLSSAASSGSHPTYASFREIADALVAD